MCKTITKTTVPQTTEELTTLNNIEHNNCAVLVT